MPTRFFRFMLDWRYSILLFALLCVGLAASGARFLEFTSDYRAFFSADNPQLMAFEALQNTYTKNDNVLFVLTPAEDGIFTRETLAAVQWLTKEAWQIPYSLRVDSVSNFQHTYAQGDDLVVEDLVADAAALSDAQLEEKKRIALAEPLLINRLISADMRHTGINVTIQLPGKKADEVPEVARFSRALAAQAMAQFPGIRVRLSGVAMLNNAFPEASQQDMQTLYPFMFAVVLLVLALLLRSIPGTLSTLVVIVLTIAATMGVTGWLGLRMTPPTTIVPIITLTLAVADCVHLLVNFLHFARQGRPKREAMLESLRINLEPIFLTSLTTAIGFLTLNFSEVPPFRDLGNMAAIGVTFAFALSVTVLPALMMILPVKSMRADTLGTVAMQRLAGFVVRRRNPLLLGTLALVVFCLLQIARNELNDEYIKYFDETVEFRTDTDFITTNLTGIYQIEYSLDAGEPGGISDPAFLHFLENFASWFRQQPHVLHVNSFSEIMKRLNMNLHGDDPQWYRLPEQRDLAAQYLLLYEFSLPFGLDLNNQINVEKSAVRFTVSLQSVSSNELLALEQRAQDWLREHAPQAITGSGSGPAIMFAHIGARNIRAMLQGTTVALLIISAILVLAFRSLRLGLISMLPNLVPIGMAFGLWGLFVGQVGLALSVVSGIALGIVVDDTVHFLSKFLRARREMDMSATDAVHYAFSTVGTALWVTSFVLVLGFGVLTLSHFQLNSGMGLLTAITIALALAADFLFLPPLLMKFGDSKHV